MDRADWRTKPTDRFILRWIKVHLSSRITPRLVPLVWLRPGMITVTSGSLGMLAGVVFGLGAGWLAALVGAASQVLDGVDGQYARLTGREGRGGAFLDSVIDRYASSAMIVGACIYLGAHVHFRPLGLLIHQQGHAHDGAVPRSLRDAFLA
jgi:phosphatidylglycerophosphate synthase